MLRNVENLHLQCTLAKGNFDDITDLYLIRGLGLLAVDQNPVIVTRFVCNGSPLNQAGMLITTHPL